MVRVERLEDLPEYKRLQKLKEKKKQQLRQQEQAPELARRNYRKKRRCSPRLTCCLIVLILFIFSLLVLTAAIAKTGLFEIPFFSKIFYRPPEPTREVIVRSLKAGQLKGDFFQKEALPISENIFIFEISEEDLTFLLQEGLEESQEPIMSEIQAVIKTKEIEIFGQLLKPKASYITIGLLPQLEDGLINFEVTKAKIGDLAMPRSLANWLVNTLLKGKLEELNQTLSQQGQLQKIELQEGKIIITVELK